MAGRHLLFQLCYTLYNMYVHILITTRAFIIVAGSGIVRYSIYSGDPNGYFSIDPLSGTIRTSSALDHETHPSVLLNVQAMSGDPPSYGHSQVRKSSNFCLIFKKE